MPRNYRCTLHKSCIYKTKSYNNTKSLFTQKACFNQHQKGMKKHVLIKKSLWHLYTWYITNTQYTMHNTGIYWIISFISYYIVYMGIYKIYCTVYWFHRNPMLDEATVDVNHQRDRNTVRTTPELCNLKRDSTVRSPKFAVGSKFAVDSRKTRGAGEWGWREVTNWMSQTQAMLCAWVGQGKGLA